MFQNESNNNNTIKKKNILKGKNARGEINLQNNDNFLFKIKGMESQDDVNT